MAVLRGRLVTGVVIVLVVLACGALCSAEEDHGFQDRATNDPTLRHAPDAGDYDEEAGEGLEGDGGEEEGGMDPLAANGADPPPEDCSKWVAAEDRSSGNTYYYDRGTRVAVWELPPGCEGRVALSSGPQEPHRVTSLTERLSSGPSMAVHTPDGQPVNLTPHGVEVEWQEVLDGKSGNSYYWNKVTGETTWDQPKHFTPRAGGADGGGAGGSGEWKQAFDPKSMKPYYYNTGTGQVQWEMPSDMTS